MLALYMLKESKARISRHCNVDDCFCAPVHTILFFPLKPKHLFSLHTQLTTLASSSHLNRRFVRLSS